MNFVKGLDCIHILGRGESWSRCPGMTDRINLPNQEVWAVNSMFIHHKSVDRIFVMHDPRNELIYEDRDYFKKVRASGLPIYSREVYEVLGPNNRKFPVDDLLSEFPIIYFTNVACWMIALAISMNPKKIAYHGIDMRAAFEYANERGGVEFWTGVAVGRGIELDIPETSAICTTNSVWGPVYGYIPITSNGMLLDLMGDYRGFNRPEILENYVLVPRPKPEKLLEWDHVYIQVSE